jgi:predicted metal-dependent enzyme (double-stranded beta helix superfamily)
MLKAARRTFDLDRFIADCCVAIHERQSQTAMREVLTRALSDPASLRDALGEPRRAQIQRLHCAPDLTILNVVWAPGMAIMPHDHRMWAMIGVYEGREDNIFWRRIKDDEGGKLEAAGARSLGKGDCWTLGRDIVHSVINPIARFTGAVHVYGGDFFNTARSEWDPETLLERPYDVDKAARLFEEANRRSLAT